MFLRITLPPRWDQVQVALVYIGVAALDFFTIIAVMTEGGPSHASDVVARYPRKVLVAPQIRYTSQRLVRLVPFRSRIAR
jgi:ABC-type sugar transport system permease subunit